MRRSWIVIGVAVILFFVGLSMFPRKVSFQAMVPVCTQEGITSTADCDVVLWKWWYMPDKLRGTIVLDGVSYEHVEYDQNGDSNVYWFVVPQKYPPELFSNSLNVSVYDEKFGALSFAYSKDGETKWYFGPAENVEEVKKIIEKYLKK